ncbi:HPF/RaiA family ribosome-associated protein [Falsiroseomonas tokyonensis]|uniref:HPF/RaiA family ribosome-associated protein n=1 Tax=Falsiroseomonas tokyonensis TaxID=430521 RepID=A0ABV7BUK4_9PROT|nr:HPF/RaiA family ribosome-associated protein [Falsiroseomonas tokyonensis]MBU8537752.1 HPF/RaiA family ribosome-associated protein [Falsiroseomonas tokyonensis]
MQIQVNTPDGAGGADLIARVEQAVAEAVGRFEAHLTRVEVHLGDVNALKGGAQDKRCMVEARPTGKAPIAVSHQAETVPKAMNGALGKLSRALDTALAPRTDHKGNASLRDNEFR